MMDVCNASLQFSISASHFSFKLCNTIFGILEYTLVGLAFSLAFRLKGHDYSGGVRSEVILRFFDQMFVKAAHDRICVCKVAELSDWCRLELTTNQRDRYFASDYEARGYNHSKSRLSRMNELGSRRNKRKAHLSRPTG